MAEKANVFQQLRKLANQLECDVTDMKKTMSMPKKQRDDSCAVVVLQDAYKQVKQLKASMQGCLSNMQNDGGFLELMDAAQKLMTKQQEQLARTEEYLQQYGYVPEPTTVTRKPHHSDHNTEDVNPAHSAPHQSGQCQNEAVAMETVNNQEKTVASPSSCASLPAVSRPVEDEGSPRTPRLEDFGLSKERLDSYQNMKPGQLFKVPEAKSCLTSAYDMTATSVISSQSDPGMTTPALFNHHGICVTPGLLGERHIPMLTPQGNKRDMLDRDGSPQCSLVGDRSSYHGNSPVPPVLLTPGIKQIKKITDGGELAQNHKKNIAHKLVTEAAHDSCSLDSPIPPMLETPGVQQMRKCPSILSNKQVESMKITDAAEEESPVPPVLQTPGFKQIKKNLMKDEDECSLPVKPVMLTDDGDNEDDELPAAPEPTVNYEKFSSFLSSISSETSGVHQMQQCPGVSNKHVESVKLRDSADDNSPVAPVLLTPGFKQIKKNLMKEEEESSLPVKPVMLTDDGDNEDDELPAAPEPTVNYEKFTSFLSSISSYKPCESQTENDKLPRTSSISSEGQTEVRTSAADPHSLNHSVRHAELTTSIKTDQSSSSKLICHKQLSRQQENIPPNQQQPLIQQESIVDVSEEEYDSQPGYLKRSLPLPVINQTIAKINQVMQEKHKRNKTCQISLTELRDDLGPNTKVMLLFLVKLQRLKQSGHGSLNDPAYVCS